MLPRRYAEIQITATDKPNMVYFAGSGSFVAYIPNKPFIKNVKMKSINKILLTNVLLKRPYNYIILP